MARQTHASTSTGPRLFPVDDVEHGHLEATAELSRVDAVRAVLAAVEPAAGEPKIVQRYSKAQTDRARRGIAQARQALEAA